jgi:hypothetical protein
VDNVKSSAYYPQASKWIATRCQEFMVYRLESEMTKEASDATKVLELPDF